jgi:serine/threonine protein kinase
LESSQNKLLSQLLEKRLLTQSEAQFCHARGLAQNAHLIDILVEQGLVTNAQADELRGLQSSGAGSFDQESSLNSIALPRPGEILGTFQVLSILGEGGMGAVYKVRGYLMGQEGLDIPAAYYALKVMNTHSPESLERFEREAQALAAVDLHPNIVRIHAFSKHGKRPYLVLDWIDGSSLENLIESGDKWELDRILESAVKVADALDFIHSRGVLHRDLKPGNILIRDFDQEVFVSDFGLAKVLHKETLTSTEDVLGTPSYMSPEQLAGDEDLGAQADIWAFGVVLYEWVTGRMPFDAENEVELAQLIMIEDPLLPSELLEMIPLDFEALLWKCLEKEPRNRYQTAAELSEDLRSIIDNETIETALPSYVRRRMALITRRHGLSSVLLFLFLLVLIILIVAALVYRVGERRALEDRQRQLLRSVKPIQSLLRREKPKLFEYVGAHLLLAAPQSMLVPLGQCRACIATRPLQSSWDYYCDLRGELKARLGENRISTLVSGRLHRDSSHTMGLFADFIRLHKRLRFPLLEESTGSHYALRRGYRLLCEGELNASRRAFSKISGRLEPIKKLGLAVVSVHQKRWTEAQSLLQEFAAEKILSIQVGALEKYIYEEQFLSWLWFESDCSMDEVTKRMEEWDRLSGDAWEGMNIRILQSFLENADEPENAAIAYKKLRFIKRSLPGVALPTPNAAVHHALGMEARNRRDKETALFHFIRARLMGSKQPNPAGYQFSDIRRTMLMAYSARKIDGMTSAFRLLLVASRAGLYVPRIRSVWLRALEEFGIFRNLLRRRPKDPYIRYWRSQNLVSDESEGALQSYKRNHKELTGLIEGGGLAKPYLAQAYLRRAELTTKLAQAPSRIYTLKKAVSDCERSLGNGHFAQDQVYRLWALIEQNPKLRLKLTQRRCDALMSRSIVKASLVQDSSINSLLKMTEKDLQQEFLDSSLQLVECMRALGKYKESLAWLVSACKPLPDSQIFLNRHLDVLLDLKRYKDAKKLVDLSKPVLSRSEYKELKRHLKNEK